jgi:hypothetical protein
MRRILCVVILCCLVAPNAWAFGGTISYKNTKTKGFAASTACGGAPGRVFLSFRDLGEVFAGLGDLFIDVSLPNGNAFSLPGVYERRGRKVVFHASDLFFDDDGFWQFSISLAGKAKLDRSHSRVTKAKLRIQGSDLSGCIGASEAKAK